MNAKKSLVRKEVCFVLVCLLASASLAACGISREGGLLREERVYASECGRIIATYDLLVLELAELIDRLPDDLQFGKSDPWTHAAGEWAKRAFQTQWEVDKLEAPPRFEEVQQQLEVTSQYFKLLGLALIDLPMNPARSLKYMREHLPLALASLLLTKEMFKELVSEAQN